MIQSASVVAFGVTSKSGIYRSQQNFYTILFVYKYYVVEVHLPTHFHNAFKWYRMFCGMFHLTWITFRFSRNQLAWEWFQRMS